MYMSNSNNNTPPTQTLSSRIFYIDRIKGFLIILVVFCHMPATPMFDFVGKYSIWQYLWTRINDIIPYILKRAKFLLVPYVFWFFIEKLEPLIYHHITMSEFVNSLPNIFYGNHAKSQTILWFLPALFILNVFISLYRKYRSVYFLVTFSALWLLFFFNIEFIAKWHVKGLIPWGVDVAFYLSPFCLVVDYVHRKYKISEIFSYLLVIFSTIIITYIESPKTLSSFHFRIDLAQLSVPYTLIGYAAMCALSIGILSIFMQTKKESILSFVGMYTLPIFVLHLFILGRFHNFLYRVTIFNTFFSNGLFIFMYSILSLFGTIFLAIIISKLLIKSSSLFKHVGMINKEFKGVE